MEQLIALILSCVVLFVPQARETDEAEPFYQYFDPSGELQMVLYFDAETQQGYGTRFQDGESGEFSFQETARQTGSGRTCGWRITVSSRRNILRV